MIKRVFSFFFRIFIFLLVSHSAWSRFQVLESQHISFPEWSSAGITATITKKTNADLQSLSFAQDRYLLDVVLGRLSLQQFNTLKSYYGFQSLVPYEPARSYELVDFLPPLIQATQGKVYLTKYYDGDKAQQEFESGVEALFPVVKNGISSFTNCYNTTKELLRLSLGGPALGPYYFFEVTWPSRDAANYWFAWFDNQQNPFGRKLSPHEPYQPGDVLVVVNINPMAPSNFNETVYHTAVVLNSRLAFEKTDSSSNDPFRISYIEDIRAKYSGPDFSTVAQYFFRPSQQGLQSFPLVTLNEATTPVEEDPTLVAADRIYRADGLDIRKVHFACETGLGGGCDPMLIEAERVYFRLDSHTGRAQLDGDPQVLFRFRDLN